MTTKTYGSITITKVEQLYTWIKFADDEYGLNMSDNPSDKSYIGIAYNQNSEQESTDPSKYTWTLIKGRDTMGCYIESSAGTLFDAGATGTTILTAYLYEGTNEIDPEGEFDYIWYVKNPDGIADTKIGDSKTFTVDISTIAGKSVYFTADDGDKDNTSVLYLARLGVMVLNKGI